MIHTQFQQLHPDGIHELATTDALKESIIVQVSNIHVTKNDRLACMISDGHYSIKAMVKEKGIIFPGIRFVRNYLDQHQNAIIKISNHAVADSATKIGIVQFSFVCKYAKIIGNPIPFVLADYQTNNTKPFLLEKELIKETCTNFYQKISKTNTNKSTEMIDQNMVKQEDIKQNKNTNIQNPQQKKITQKDVKKEVKKEETGKKQIHLPAPMPLTGTVKDFETIKGLFVGLKNWHLLCRIMKLEYQEFKKKGTETNMQVLSIELMDRSNVKISGAFFSEAAVKFKDQLKVDCVYKISQGTIQNQNYNNSKNEKFSPFRLIFHINSFFEEVSDVKIIANQEDTAITLEQLLYEKILGQEYDIIAILVDIEEPKEFNKEGRTLLRWNWVFADPKAKKVINAILWNDKIKPNRQLIGKTCILSNFQLHDYNSSLTLNSNRKSAIKSSNNYQYKQLEDLVMGEFKSYENLSERKGNNEEGANANQNICKNMKILEQKIAQMLPGDNIRSDLDVFLTKMAMKKWYYEACPHCTKSGEKQSTCNNCSKFIDETVPHFIMGVEICDNYGSLWTTAYDDFGKKIFMSSQGNIIKKLMEYEINQLKDITENYLYQEYKLRIYTKKDQEGRIKHNVGKIQLCSENFAKMAEENVERIKQLMMEN